MYSIYGYPKKVTKQDRLISAIDSTKKLDKVIEILDEGAKVDSPDSYGNLPLSYAVARNKPKMVELLLKRGADPNKKNSEALWNAVKLEQNDSLRLLLDAGANPNVKDAKGVPLINQVEGVEKIRLLITHGLDPNTMVGDSPYVFTLIARHQYALIQLMIEKGLNPSIISTKGTTLIMTAARFNYDDIVETFIKAGTDVNAVNSIGETALDIAMSNDNVKTVEKLLKGGATVSINTLHRFLKTGKKLKYFSMIFEKMPKDDLNSKDADGKPLLFEVIESIERLQTLDILKAFLDAGADVNVTDAKGLNALVLPAATSLAVFELLISKGIDTNVQDKDGLNPLYYFIRNGGKVENLKRFVEAGRFDVNHKNTREMTPLLFAVNAGAIQYIDPLIELGADVNAVMDNGMNAIHIAIMSPGIVHVPSKIELIKKLIAKGVDFNRKSANGTTPLVLSILKARSDPANLSAVTLYLLSIPDIDFRSSNDDIKMPPAEMAASFALLSVLEAIMAKGFDINEKLSNGFSLLENAQRGEFDATINNYILAEFEPNTSALWRGYTQSDLVKFDTIFDTKRDMRGRIPAANVSLCPVCHEFVFRGEACKYMFHNCTQGGHLYHRRLYNTYKTADGRIWWCIVCGRICNGHTHYRVASHATKPPLEVPGPGADLFSDDCTGAERGGGIKEKLKRFIRLREVSKELNEQIGKITVNKAFKKQVEATWDAPFTVRTNVAAEQALAKKYTLPATNFPNAPAVLPGNKPPKENWNKKNYPDVARTAEEAAGFEAPKLVKGKNHGGSQNDNIDVIQFHHVRKDGTVNDHAARFISQEYFEMWIGSMNKGYSAERFGYCWDIGQGCTARLFPDEVKPFVDADTYEEYRRKFNWKFAAQEGGAGDVDFFHHMENGQCGLPGSEAKGGRRARRRFRKTRRALKKRKGTTRRR